MRASLPDERVQTYAPFWTRTLVGRGPPDVQLFGDCVMLRCIVRAIQDVGVW